MSTRATVTINGPDERQKVATWARNVELGTVVTFRKKSRSTEQSAKMWAMLHEIAEQLEWYGAKLEAEDWKDMATASLRHARVVPGIDKGTYVPLGMHTSTMTIEEMTNLIELLYAFGAEHGVIFKEPKEQNSEAPPLSASDADTPTPKVSAEADEPSPSSSASDLQSGSKTGQVEPDTAGGGETSPSSAIDRENAILIRYARDVLPMAAEKGVSIDAPKAIEAEYASEIKTLSKLGISKARAISESMRAIHEDPEPAVRLEIVLEHYAEFLDTTVEELRGEA